MAAAGIMSHLGLYRRNGSLCCSDNGLLSRLQKVSIWKSSEINFLFLRDTCACATYSTQKKNSWGKNVSHSSHLSIRPRWWNLKDEAHFFNISSLYSRISFYIASRSLTFIFPALRVRRVLFVPGGFFDHQGNESSPG